MDARIFRGGTGKRRIEDGEYFGLNDACDEEKEKSFVIYPEKKNDRRYGCSRKFGFGRRQKTRTNPTHTRS
jgi:hypothetical protein